MEISNEFLQEIIGLNIELLHKDFLSEKHRLAYKYLNDLPFETLTVTQKVYVINYRDCIKFINAMHQKEYYMSLLKDSPYNEFDSEEIENTLREDFLNNLSADSIIELLPRLDLRDFFDGEVTRERTLQELSEIVTKIMISKKVSILNLLNAYGSFFGEDSNEYKIIDGLVVVLIDYWVDNYSLQYYDYEFIFKYHLSSCTENNSLILMLNSKDPEIFALAVDLITLQYYNIQI